MRRERDDQYFSADARAAAHDAEVHRYPQGRGVEGGGG
jgi:hypothetical protein